jgi:hypothetical protein
MSYPVVSDDLRLSNISDSNVRDGIDAVVKTTQQRESCAWTYLRDNPPSESTGYMFSNDPVFSAISGRGILAHRMHGQCATCSTLQLTAWMRI